LEAYGELVVAEKIEIVTSLEEMSQRERDALQIVQEGGIALGLTSRALVSKRWVKRDCCSACILRSCVFLNRAPRAQWNRSLNRSARASSCVYSMWSS